MARMIPSVISPEIKSNAERKAFEWFRDDPSTEDWIVLHSLGISSHNKVIYGEIDFLVIVPYMGLFAIEVKGGRVQRTNGIWSYTDRYGRVSTKERGPFDQAWDGIFSVIGTLKKRFDTNHSHLSDVFFGIGVMFPDIDYDAVGCDEEQWQVFDCNDLNCVGDFIRRVFEGSKKKWEKLNNRPLPFRKLPGPDDVNYIVSLLRGDFDKAVSINVLMRYAEEELVELTKEQYRCLDQLDDNPRCLIKGPAGTGKTLLAIEEAKRSVACGMKVALFCYNANLGEWLKRYIKNVPDNLKPDYVGTFHSYMMSVTSQKDNQLMFPDNVDELDFFYSETVPVSTRQVLTEINNSEKFDKIIVDEAQDLINFRYLDVFDVCLKKGFVRGKWTMFGDFSMQAIYAEGVTEQEMFDILEERTSFIRFKLTINCRNTKPICDEIETVTGFQRPSDLWKRVDGPPVNYITYSNMDDQEAKLESILDSLIVKNVPEKSITILSPARRENSVVSLVSKYNIRNYNDYSDKCITFSTIQGFKGLENSVIILTDINTFKDKKLMYVALSRARTCLYVLENNNAAGEYVQLQMRRLLACSRTEEIK